MNRTSSGNAFRGRCFFMWNYILAGGCAGIIAGLFGAGGGLVLVPLLRRCGDLASDSVFPASVATILPICVDQIHWQRPSPHRWKTVPYTGSDCR